jgi:hypothetical protein
MARKAGIDETLPKRITSIRSLPTKPNRNPQPRTHHDHYCHFLLLPARGSCRSRVTFRAFLPEDQGRPRAAFCFADYRLCRAPAKCLRVYLNLPDFRFSP